MSTTDLGEFTAGEKPLENLLNTFKNADGTVIDISGMQVRFSYREHWTGVATTRNGSVVNGPAGQAGYVWDGSEFVHAGAWEGDLWVGNGVNRIAAYRYRWTVKAAVGAIPSI